MVGERVEMLHCPMVGTIINHRTPTQATKTRMVPSDRPIEQVRRAPFSPMAPRRSTRTAYARWNGRVCTSSVGATTSSTFSDDARFAARRRRSESTLSSMASYESFFPATVSSMSTSTTSAESLPFGVLRSDVSRGAGSPLPVVPDSNTTIPPSLLCISSTQLPSSSLSRRFLPSRRKMGEGSAADAGNVCSGFTREPTTEYRVVSFERSPRPARNSGSRGCAYNMVEIIAH